MKNNIYICVCVGGVYIYLRHCAVQQKLTCYKSAICQQNKFLKKILLRKDMF